MTEPARAPQSFRLLVLMPNWLGDAIMATGLLTLLDANRDLPDGRRLHLTLGVGSSWEPLFRDDSRCDDLLLVERTGRHGGGAGAFRLSRDLASGNFQAVLLGPPSLRVAAAAFLARIPSRTGYASDGRGLLLSTPVRPLPRGQVHFFAEMLELGRTFLEKQGRSLAEDGFPRATSLPGCEGTVPVDPGSYARWVLAPGATYGLAKTWPLKQALDFCRLAIETAGVEVVLLGDAGASTFAQDLTSGLGMEASTTLAGRPGLVDLTGRTTLPEVVALLKGSSAFVGNDSGLMHLSAALGVPTIGIFGSSNPAWTAPVGVSARALAARGFACQPCYRRTCNQPEFCLDTITGQQVLSEVRQLLASGKGATP